MFPSTEKINFVFTKVQIEESQRPISNFSKMENFNSSKLRKNILSILRVQNSKLLSYEN